MVVFLFCRFGRGKNAKVSHKYVDYLKLAPVLEESEQFVFLLFIWKAHVYTIFITRVNSENPCSIFFFTDRNVEPLWLQEAFAHGSALWDTNKFRFLEILFWQLFLVLVILQRNYKVLSAFSSHEINNSKSLFISFKLRWN